MTTPHQVTNPTTPPGAPISLPEQWLFVQMSDEGEAYLTWCADRAAILWAVTQAVFSNPLDKLDEDETQQVEGITDSLIEDGFFDFEGDPGLKLFRVAGADRSHRAAGASPDVAKMVEGVRRAASELGDMRVMATRDRANSDDVSEAQQAFDIELNALGAAATQARAAEPALAREPLSKARVEEAWLECAARDRFGVFSAGIRFAERHLGITADSARADVGAEPRKSQAHALAEEVKTAWGRQDPKRLWTAIEALEVLAAQTPGEGWMPIESAPIDQKLLLTNALAGWVEQGYWDDERGEWWPHNVHWTDGHSEQLYPSHFQPLPKPPATPGEAQS